MLNRPTLTGLSLASTGSKIRFRGLGIVGVKFNQWTGRMDLLLGVLNLGLVVPAT
jgi:hypothetical protein